MELLTICNQKIILKLYTPLPNPVGTSVIRDSKFHRRITYHWQKYFFYHYLFQIILPLLVLTVPAHTDRMKSGFYLALFMELWDNILYI